MAATTQDIEYEHQADFAVPLDTLLADAASGSLGRFVPGSEVLLWGAALARRPATVARRVTGWASDVGRIAIGTSDIEPARKDKRFADDAWSTNPIFRRCMQYYLAGSRTLQQLLDDVDLDAQSEKRLQLVLDNIVGAAAPSNVFWLNPTALKTAVDTRGMSVLRGTRNFVGDMARAPRVPSMVDARKFEVGKTLAATPGAVVLRTPVFELIQYTPVTAKVRPTPLLMVPPMINKFYVLDLAAGRSMVEHLVGAGQQVFVISWRNPTGKQADWGMDTYVEAVLDAMEATRKICQVKSTIVHGTCAGGIISAMTAAYLARKQRADEIAALVLGDAAGSEGRRHHQRDDGSRAGRRGYCVFICGRLSRRSPAGRSVRLAASHRSGMDVLGQQLSAGQESAGLRCAVLEFRYHAYARTPAPRLSGLGDEQ